MVKRIIGTVAYDGCIKQSPRANITAGTLKIVFHLNMYAILKFPSASAKKRREAQKLLRDKCALSLSLTHHLGVLILCNFFKIKQSACQLHRGRGGIIKFTNNLNEELSKKNLN